MKFHEYADIWPMMGPSESSELAENIRRRGLLEPITTFEGAILDGRNRFNACAVADVQPKFTEFKGDKEAAIAFVNSKNNCRRHLTAGQKAAAGAECLELFQKEAKQRQVASQNNKTGRAVQAKLPEQLKHGKNGESREKAAQQTGASPRYVSDAKRIKEEAPEVFEEVKNGTKTIPQAKREIQKSKPVQKPAKEEWKTLRNKAVATAEALMRAIGDLREKRASKEHDPAIKACNGIWTRLKQW